MLASSLSRVMPALWTTRSRPPWRVRACSTIRVPASGGGDVEPGARCRRPRSRPRRGRRPRPGRRRRRRWRRRGPACGRCRPRCRGPHRSRPRPCRRAGGRGPRGPRRPRPPRRGTPGRRRRPTGPRGGRATVPSAAASLPSATRTRLAVAPARSSLPTLRVIPSSARRAARWATVAARRGSRPMTTTRAHRRSRLRAGPSVARSASRSSGPSARSGRRRPRRAAPPRAPPRRGPRRRWPARRGGR